MIAEVVDRFLELLRERYGEDLEGFRAVCLHHLKACREIRAAKNDLDKVVVVALGDPGYQWLNELSRLAVHGSPGFLGVMLAPGCDQTDVLLAIAESLKENYCGQWVLGKAVVDRDLIAGLDATTRLRREVWSTLKMVRSNVELVGPTFMCWQGENLQEEGLYEMQDLANRAGWRFIILAGIREPLEFQDQFVNGKGKGLARFRSVAPVVTDLDASLWPKALCEVNELVQNAFNAMDGCSSELVFEALISSLEA